ncbi:phage integrase SAM-like domain-containing protein [Sediminicola arcticus]|jgi:hypothetical protein|uniref:Phage integrase SAM-like domain-containing protein n=1 Tax=Sediminicola arcticus TaxID=1574308 RepID=A0ABV2SSE0_9FLAO
MTINLKLIKRPLKDGTCNIVFDILDGRSYRKKILTGITIEPKHWDEKKGRVKASYANAIILNKALEEFRIKVNTCEDKYQTKQFSRQEVVSFLEGKVGFDSVDEYIETEIKESRSGATYIDYRTAINSLKYYTDIKDKLLFHEVNYGLLDRYKRNFLKSGKRATSYNSNLTKIRAIMNDAYNKGFIFEKFELPKGLRMASRRSEIRTCTTEDFKEAILKVKSIYEWQALGFYLLMFCTRGMYPSDIVNFKMANFDGINDMSKFCDSKNKYLVHRRAKTKNRGNDDMWIMIDDYPTYKLLKTLKYSIIFTHYKSKPEIIPSFDDEIAIFKYDVDTQYDVHGNVWDIYKKKVSRLLGYSYKTARKTFNTYALELSVSDTIRRVLLGHTDDSMLAHYDNLNTKKFVKQVENAHKKVLRDFKASELMELLLEKIKALEVPDFIYNDDLFMDEKGFWEEVHKALKIK